jgi:hypothetical protein
MTRTLTSVAQLPERNVATPHAAFEGLLRTLRWANWDNVAPAAGIISSVSDMAKWIDESEFTRAEPR